MLERFERQLRQVTFQNKKLDEIFQYAVFGRGKRIRPLLLLEFNRLFSGNIEKALPFATALELIHNYSLIHDDLPAMDNDTYRRGRWTVFKRYGEDLAILAGDAFLNKAYEILLEAATTPKEKEAACYISKRAGACGMITGQILDIQNQKDQLEEMYEKKTCDLIKAACVAGALTANAPRHFLSDVEAYGYSVGMAFQLIDDILDEKKDHDNGKLTYCTLYGQNKTREKAKYFTSRAYRILDQWDGNEALKNITNKLLVREY